MSPSRVRTSPYFFINFTNSPDGAVMDRHRDQANQSDRGIRTTYPLPNNGMKRNVRMEPLAVTFAQPGSFSPTAQCTTPSNSLTWRTSSNSGPLEVRSAGPE
jgi:hypothetical protein